MFLEFEVKNDELLLTVRTGPLEAYDPKDHKEVADLFDKVQKLDKQLKKLRAKVAPQLTEIKEKVENFNKSQMSRTED